MTVKVDGENLTIEDVHDVARKGEKVEISEYQIENIERSRSIVEETIRSDKVDTVSTPVSENWQMYR